MKVAATVRKHRDGFVAAVRHGLSNGLIEGLNNKVRLIIRRPYGFHSADAALALVMLSCGPIELQLPRASSMSSDRIGVSPTLMPGEPYIGSAQPLRAMQPMGGRSVGCRLQTRPGSPPRRSHRSASHYPASPRQPSNRDAGRRCRYASPQSSDGH